MRNFPNFEKLDREMQFRHAHNKAIEFLKSQEISLDDFTDLYGEQVINSDKKRVSDLKRIFSEKLESDPQAKEVLEVAKVVEAIVIENIELSDWMGESVETLPVSLYDDYVNGVDTIVEIDEGENSATHMVLGIDVTIANELTKKLDRIKEEIDGDKLAIVKYFTSETLHFRGEIRNIPRVVIALDGQTAHNLINLWTQVSGGKKLLAGHFIQYQILEEIKMQLEIFYNYCVKTAKDGFADRYKRSLDVIKKIIEEKEEAGHERDGAFFELKHQLDHKFSAA